MRSAFASFSGLGARPDSDLVLRSVIWSCIRSDVMGVLSSCEAMERNSSRAPSRALSSAVRSRSAAMLSWECTRASSSCAENGFTR